jgi:DNA-binding NarL/FixJ family response regulator
MYFVLSSRPEYSVVAQASAITEAVSIAKRETPDIVIIDPSDAECAFEIIASVSRLPGSPKVIVYSGHASAEHAMRALDAGAAGYLTSASSAAEMLDAVHTVIGGDTFISPCIATKLIASLRTAALRKQAAQKMKLTVREEQIVGLLHKGKTNREIAQGLGLTEKTVKHYMTVLMHKVAARSRLEVVLALKDFDPAMSPSVSRAFN